MQGDLGDSWLLTAATALAEQPSRIKKLFANTGYSSDSYFVVFFHPGGIKTAITIDDRIPIKQFGHVSKGNWKFLNDGIMKGNNEWWLVLLEKAYAKMNVNYANLNKGTAGEALTTITGYPTSYYGPDRLSRLSDYELFDLLDHALDKYYPIVSASRD
jgi:hypothetical protein